jgi:hypothetical protein
MSGPQNGEESARRGSLYGRKMQASHERDPGGKRRHRRLEEKLRKYEVHAEGYEFVPALLGYPRRLVVMGARLWPRERGLR